jgi:ABC-type Fe3+-siderophore transport system, permease component
MLLLTGLAVNALFMSAIGFLSYIARDPQARSITFWSLGTLSGASWTAVQVVAVSTIGGTALAMTYAKQLNALMIGEEEAMYLGVNVNRLKWIILSINVVIVAVATAFTGVISFVGLIVPHILRMMRGSDNRFSHLRQRADRRDFAQRGRPDRASGFTAGRAADRHRHIGRGRAGIPLPAASTTIRFLICARSKQHNL